MKTRVIIKGKREDAERECTQRNMPFVFENELDHWDQTIGLIDTGDPNTEEAIVRWFCETVQADRTEPFPAGTLLHYRWLVD